VEDVDDIGARLAPHVRDIPDFPKPGVTFKDITPLLGDPSAFRAAVDSLVEAYAGDHVTKVLGVEARGFILAAPVAYGLGAGFVPVRKVGKLPWAVESAEYALEYGTDVLEVHQDAVTAGERVLIVDDVLATGGTAAATVRLAEALGAEVVGLAFLIELGFLDGKRLLPGRRVVSLLR
jgi:adenine phosphoribosyltransferase